MAATVATGTDDRYVVSHLTDPLAGRVDCSNDDRAAPVRE